MGLSCKPWEPKFRSKFAKEDAKQKKQEEERKKLIAKNTKNLSK